MRIKLIISIFFIITSAQIANAFNLSPEIFNNSAVQFIEHNNEERFGSYLSMELNIEPIADLFKQLLITNKSSLTSRGEAHITVVTPIEYYDILKKQDVTITEINKIANRYNIQSSKFDIVCFGKGQAVINDKTEYTYYVVVNSNDLIKIRKDIEKLFIQKGGDPNKFKSEQYYPHITVGFTKRDLHEADGVIKNSDSCFSEIIVTSQ